MPLVWLGSSSAFLFVAAFLISSVSLRFIILTRLLLLVDFVLTRLAILLWTLLRCHHLMILFKLTHSSRMIFLDRIIFKSGRSSDRYRLFLLLLHGLPFSRLHISADTLRSWWLWICLSRLVGILLKGSPFAAATARLGCTNVSMYWWFLLCFILSFLHKVVNHVIVTKAFRFPFWSPTVSLARRWNRARVLMQ